MPRGQQQRVSPHHTQPQASAVEETQLPPALLRLAAIARRMAVRVSMGKFGLALENDARAALDLWDALPDELKREGD